jgi:hypothetical protein
MAVLLPEFNPNRGLIEIIEAEGQAFVSLYDFMDAYDGGPARERGISRAQSQAQGMGVRGDHSNAGCTNRIGD